MLHVKCNYCWMNWHAKPSSQLNWRSSIYFSGYAAFHAGCEFGPQCLKGMKLFRPRFFSNVIQVTKIQIVQQVKVAHCRICLSLFHHWWKLSSFCDLQCVLFLWCISSWGRLTYKNQIWHIRLIMMQMQNSGCWWACCHKCMPRSCFIIFIFCPVLHL